MPCSQGNHQIIIIPVHTELCHCKKTGGNIRLRSNRIKDTRVFAFHLIQIIQSKYHSRHITFPCIL